MQTILFILLEFLLTGFYCYNNYEMQKIAYFGDVHISDNPTLYPALPASKWRKFAFIRSVNARVPASTKCKVHKWSRPFDLGKACFSRPQLKRLQDRYEQSISPWIPTRQVWPQIEEKMCVIRLFKLSAYVYVQKLSPALRGRKQRRVAVNGFTAGVLRCFWCAPVFFRVQWCTILQFLNNSNRCTLRYYGVPRQKNYFVLSHIWSKTRPRITLFCYNEALLCSNK